MAPIGAQPSLVSGRLAGLVVVVVVVWAVLRRRLGPTRKLNDDPARRKPRRPPARARERADASAAAVAAAASPDALGAAPNVACRRMLAPPSCSCQLKKSRALARPLAGGLARRLVARSQTHAHVTRLCLAGATGGPSRRAKPLARRLLLAQLH
jgi:hypothetical protein